MPPWTTTSVRRGVLQSAVGPEARSQRDARPVHQAAPQRAAGLLLGLEAARAHPAVAIGRAAALEVDLVQHPVAVERMEAAERLVDLVLGVADIDAVDVGRDRALDDIEIGSVHLLVQRRPGAVEIGMVAWPQRGDDRRQTFEFHGLA